MWITPFGHPGITGYVLLPPAFRSLSRPSSPDSSKASAINLYSLDHIIFSAFKPFHLSAVRVFFIQAFFPFHSAFRVSFLLPYLFRYGFRPSFVISKNVRSQSIFPDSSGKETIYSYLCVHKHSLFLFLKGGDPAAPSGTTTLLRLHPPHEAYLRQRPPCG